MTVAEIAVEFLSVRAAFADALGVEALVSIHHNAPTWAASSVPGSEVYVQSASTDLARTDSARLGGLLYEEITASLATFDNVTWSRAANAGVLRVLSTQGSDAYGMIVRPSVPAVLVEYGYLSNFMYFHVIGLRLLPGVLVCGHGDGHRSGGAGTDLNTIRRDNR